MRVLAFDPGDSTGIALIEGASVTMTWQVGGGVDGFLDWWDYHSGLIDTIDAFVYEDYISDGSTTGRVWSSEIVGAIRALTWRMGVKVVSQLRSDKAALFGHKSRGDAGERERRSWLESKGFKGETIHCLDAITHGLVFLKRQRDPEVLAKYWGI